VVPKTNSPDFAYVRIANDLAARIGAGEFPGHLPGERKLAQEYGVAYLTLRHAMTLLRERRLIATSHGRPSSIAQSGRGPDGAPPAPASAGDAPATPGSAP
jgi:DNA-binding GntR family transcriptional regulator